MLAFYVISRTQFSWMHGMRCTRIKWIRILETLSLFYEMCLQKGGTILPFFNGLYRYQRQWLSASSSSQPPGNWYNVRHNLSSIHNSFKRIAFRVGSSLAALQFSIGWNANKVSCEWESFWKCWFSSYKKTCSLKQILLSRYSDFIFVK